MVRITTTVIQCPTDENGRLAIVHAQVQTDKGVFDGIGDASPDNVGRMIAPHTVRMAETRAKARALRDAINVGVTAFEELGDVEDDALKPLPENRLSDRYKPRPADPIPKPASPHPDTVPPVQVVAGSTGKITAQQRDRLIKLSAAVGRSFTDSPDLTAEEAAAQIRELVGIFNGQAKQTARERVEQRQ